MSKLKDIVCSSWTISDRAAGLIVAFVGVTLAFGMHSLLARAFAVLIVFVGANFLLHSFGYRYRPLFSLLHWIAAVTTATADRTRRLPVIRHVTLARFYTGAIVFWIVNGVLELMLFGFGEEKALHALGGLSLSCFWIFFAYSQLRQTRASKGQAKTA